MSLRARRLSSSAREGLIVDVLLGDGQGLLQQRDRPEAPEVDQIQRLVAQQSRMQTRIHRFGVDLGESEVRDGERPLTIARVAEDRAQDEKQIEALDPRGPGSIGDERPQLQHELAEAGGGRERVLRLRVAHRIGGGDERLPVVLRELPVVRERGGIPRVTARALGLERLGIGAMQPGALTREQIVVHCFTKEGVPEPIVVVDHDQDAAARRLADRLVELLLGAIGEARDQRMRQRALRTGGDLDDVLRIVAETIEPGQQQVAEAIGKRAVRASRDLLDEERHALGTFLHALEGGFGQRATGDLRGQLPHRGFVEPGEREALEQARTGGLADEAAHGVATPHVVAPAGEEQQDATAARARRRNDRIASVDSSAQCRSSTTSTCGARSAAASMREAMASRSRSGLVRSRSVEHRRAQAAASPAPRRPHRPTHAPVRFPCA